VLDQIEGPVDGVVGTNEKICAGSGQLLGGREHEFGDAGPVIGADALHIFRQRVGVQRDFGMIVRAQHLRAFERDGAVAEGGSFGAASDDADVERHSCQFPAASCQFVSND
jgi:hypothetical protein